MENKEKSEENQIPQHIIDEEKVDETIDQIYDRKQMEMFDDDGWNWSGQGLI